MQFWSFDSRDPIFNIANWRISVQIVTLENLYGLPQEHCQVSQSGPSWEIRCDRLSWAAQQQATDGECHVRTSIDVNGECRLKVMARAPHKIRCIKILVRGLPPLVTLDSLDQPNEIPFEGLIAEYPTRLRLPVFFAQARVSEGEQVDSTGPVYGFRCEDSQVRAKRFAIYQERFGSLAGTYTVELILEQDARKFGATMETSDWVIGQAVDVNAFRDTQLRYAEVHLGLAPWQQRTDFPKWAKHISLCLTLHGMHWSGYIFNTYDQMAEILRFVSERIDGSQVLAYLPGWEGRYYWQYGDYRPEPMLGGEEGFARLCDAARELGVHVMPMFGGNCVNAWFPNFHEYGPNAYMQSATRNRFHGNQPDWDTARAHDTGWQAWLNPGHPAWQEELCRQIHQLQERFGFDSVFLDTIHVWTNDPDFGVFEGLQQLVARLRDGRPDFLVTAENWYDAMLGVFPIFQDTRHWQAAPKWVSRYARLVAHLLDQEPSRGSTGVHELGFNPYELHPLEEGYIPTIAFVDGTLQKARSQVEAAIAQGREYARKFAA